MSGRELDADGTDSYHPEHPWEQAGHPLYLSPGLRTQGNWPPVLAQAHGPSEEKLWLSLPKGLPPEVRDLRWFGPGVTR